MNIQTYAESRDQQPFDWNKWLTNALSNPPSDEEWVAAKERSRSWTTCACGNQCAIIPRDWVGAPVDRVLATLGGQHGFYGSICENDAQTALHFLHLIEQRSAYIIQELSQ